MRLTLASPYFVPLRGMQESKHAEELVETLYIKPYANIAKKDRTRVRRTRYSPVVAKKIGLLARSPVALRL